MDTKDGSGPRNHHQSHMNKSTKLLRHRSPGSPFTMFREHQHIPTLQECLQRTNRMRHMGPGSNSLSNLTRPTYLPTGTQLTEMQSPIYAPSTLDLVANRPMSHAENLVTAGVREHRSPPPRSFLKSTHLSFAAAPLGQEQPYTKPMPRSHPHPTFIVPSTATP